MHALVWGLIVSVCFLCAVKVVDVHDTVDEVHSTFILPPNKTGEEMTEGGTRARAKPQQSIAAP